MNTLQLTRNDRGGLKFPCNLAQHYGGPFPGSGPAPRGTVYVQGYGQVASGPMPKPTKADWEWYHAQQNHRPGRTIPLDQLGAAQRYMVDETSLKLYLAGEPLSTPKNGCLR